MSLKHCKKRYQGHEEDSWKERIGIVKRKPPESHCQIPSRWGRTKGSSASVRQQIQGLEAGDWVPGTNQEVPGWRAKRKPTRHDVRRLQDGDVQPNRNGAQNATVPGDLNRSKKLGFEESAQMNADFSARFDS